MRWPTSCRSARRRCAAGCRSSAAARSWAPSASAAAPENRTSTAPRPLSRCCSARSAGAWMIAGSNHPRHDDGRPMAEPRTPLSTYLVLGSLIALGPLASELYLPALPDMARVLETSPSLAQATVATCLIGLALGQLVAGPFSDGRGRRGPLLAGVALFVLTSGLC